MLYRDATCPYPECYSFKSDCFMYLESFPCIILLYHTLFSCLFRQNTGCAYQQPTEADLVYKWGGRAVRRPCQCSSFLCQTCFSYAARTCEAIDSKKSGGDNRESLLYILYLNLAQIPISWHEQRDRRGRGTYGPIQRVLIIILYERHAPTNFIYSRDGLFPNMCWGKKLQLSLALAFPSYISIIYTHCVALDIQEIHIANHPASFVEKCSPDKKIKKSKTSAKAVKGLIVKYAFSTLECSSTAGDYVEVGPPALARVEIMHLRRNHYPIMEHHSCLPRQSLFVSGFFLISNAFFFFLCFSFLGRVSV